MNNYDTSSTGNDIELSVTYDEYENQRMYDEWLDDRVNRLNFGRDSLYLIGNSEVSMYSTTSLKRMKKVELWDMHCNYGYECGVDSSNYSKAELIIDLQHVTIRHHYEYLISKYTWHEIKEHIEHANYISHGYSQGDAAYIVSIDGFGEHERNDIDHVLWDAPIRIYLSVDGDDSLGYELLDDMYKYDRAAIVNKIELLDIPNSSIGWIIYNLPNEPEYL